MNFLIVFQTMLSLRYSDTREQHFFYSKHFKGQKKKKIELGTSLINTGQFWMRWNVLIHLTHSRIRKLYMCLSKQQNKKAKHMSITSRVNRQQFSFTLMDNIILPTTMWWRILFPPKAEQNYMFIPSIHGASSSLNRPISLNVHNIFLHLLFSFK